MHVLYFDINSSINPLGTVSKYTLVAKNVSVIVTTLIGGALDNVIVGLIFCVLFTLSILFTLCNIDQGRLGSLAPDP